MPIQQMLLGVGAATKTYVDDIFSTYLWAGTGFSNSITINNGIDLATEGGLVWLKMRGSNFSHGLYDTVRGTTKEIRSDTTAANSTESSGITAFNSNGFTSGGRHNQNSECCSWSFRKAPGFFDIVTWTGNASGPKRSISHNLGSVSLV